MRDIVPRRWRHNVAILTAASGDVTRGGLLRFALGQAPCLRCGTLRVGTSGLKRSSSEPTCPPSGQILEVCHSAGQPVRDNTRSFPGVYPAGRKNEFSGCLPVAKCSALLQSALHLQRCTCSRLHESQTNRPGRRLLSLYFQFQPVLFFACHSYTH